MMKRLGVVALATALFLPEAAAQSVLQRDGWQATRLEAYLPDPARRIPWLNVDSKAPLPKRHRFHDYPIGKRVLAVAPLRLRPDRSGTPVS